MRVRAPADVRTRTRFRAVRRDLDAHDGRAWQVRVELDLEDSTLVEVAEELLTSDKLSAEVVTGRGSVLRLTTEQASWLRHKLDVLLSYVDEGAETVVVGDVDSAMVEPGWCTSVEAARRLGLRSNEFWARVKRLDAVPVHRVKHVSYWNEDQVRALGFCADSGNRGASAGVRGA